MPNEFSQRLQQAITSAGFSGSQLAAHLGVSRGLVSHWTTGRQSPPDDRIPVIATFLGVDVGFLRGEFDEVHAPGAVLELSWHYRPAPEDGGRDYGNANVFATPADTRTLQRESGQNTKDQRLSLKAHLRYSLIELHRGTPEFEAFFEALRFAGLRDHLVAAGATPSRQGKKLKAALAQLDSAEKVFLLRIDDFGTTGLYGDEHSGPELNPFAALIRNNMDSSKTSQTAGGAYGLGKAVLWRCSGISTVLFSSHLAERHRGDHPKGLLRIIGKTELTWHQLEGEEPCAGPGWLGGDGNVSQWVQPKALEPLFLDRQRLPTGVSSAEASGTSMLVVDLRDPGGKKELDPDKLVDQLCEQAALNFWPAIESGDLQITVEHQVGSSDPRVCLVDPEQTAAGPFVRAFRDLLNDDIVAQPEPGETGRTSADLVVPATRANAPAVQPGQPERDSEATLLVRLATDDDTADRRFLGRVALVRGRGMVVKYWDRRNVVVGGRPFHGVLLAGEVWGSDVAQTAAEVFLRLSEPPAHNKWAFCQDLADNYERGAGRKLDDLFEHATKQLKPLIRPDDEGHQDEPKALKRLLQVGPPRTRPKLARLRNTRLSFQPATGQWEVQGEIKVNDRRQALRASIELQVVPESGGRQRIPWESIEVVSCTRGDATVAADGSIHIERRTSVVHWTARSMPAPGGLRLDRCLAEPKFVAVARSDSTTGS